MKFTKKIVIRTDVVNARGESPLYLQCFINSLRSRICLDLHVNPKYFNKKSENCRLSMPNISPGEKPGKTATDFNLILGKVLGKVHDIELDARLEDKDLTKEEFEELYLNTSSKKMFVDFMETQVLSRFKNGYIDNQTKKNTLGTVLRLREYRKDVKFAELNIDYVRSFDKWLEKKYGNGLNTRWTRHKDVKAYINIAIDVGYRISNPYNKFKARQTKSSVTYLTPKEVYGLEKLFDSKDLELKYQSTLTAFLFACYTGLRISDVGLVEKNMVQNGMLVFTPFKTRKIEKEVKIPLTKKALKFIVGNDSKFIESKYSDQKMNQHLKVIASKAFITKNVTFHVARHTFATRYIAIGGQIQNLQKILGHSKIATTQIYAEVMDESLIADMALFDAV